MKNYPMVGTYDPTMSLPNVKHELMVRHMIANGGNKKAAYRKAFIPDGEKLPASQANKAYLIFKRKDVQARYQFLLDQQLDDAGLDSRSLLMKSSKLVDAAVAKKDINGFATMVNVIQKLKGEESIKIANVTQTINVTPEDSKAIEGLFDKLN